MIVGGKHGEQVLSLSGTAANSSTNTAVYYSSVTGAITTTGSADIVFSLPLKQGDRVTGVTFAMFGDGAVDITQADVRLVTAAGVSSSLGGSGVQNNVAAAWADVSINVLDTTLGAGESIFIVISANAANLSINNLRITYSRP